MSVIDLNEVRRRPGIEKSLERTLKLWGEPLPSAGREEGIAWAKDPANAKYLSNLVTRFWWPDVRAVERDGERLTLQVGELLHYLVRPAHGPGSPAPPSVDWDNPTTSQIQGLSELVGRNLGLDRPVAEVLADLVEIVGEWEVWAMINSWTIDSRFLSGWVAGAVDYWDAVRPPD